MNSIQDAITQACRATHLRAKARAAKTERRAATLNAWAEVHSAAASRSLNLCCVEVALSIREALR